MSNQDQQTRQLILDSANRMFGDLVDKPLLDRAEQGKLAEDLWQQVRTNGFNQLGSAASGTTMSDLFAFLQVCGQYAVPLPVADTLLVNLWCGESSELAGIGLLGEGEIQNVVWGRAASRVVGVSPDGPAGVLVSDPQVAKQGKNMAGEPCDDIALNDPATCETGPAPFAQVALTRINLIAGSLQTLLELGILFATERTQFGRPISKFQAIQHSLAVVAAEVAASKRAADAAVDAWGDDRFVVEVAASKARVGEATGLVAEQIHQIHGAMGFTHEHRLHHFSRRAWAWRDEFGSEFYWQRQLGKHLAGVGADGVWDFIATPS